MFKRILLFITIILTFSTSTLACTSVLFADNKFAVMTGRNMDLNTSWLDVIKTSLIVYPAGIARDGLSQINPMQWTSKYGSIVTAMYQDQLPADGMNEQGLTVHLQWFEIANYGRRDISLPGLSVGIWVQFYLDNFKTVAEAVRFTQTTPFQIVPLYNPKTNDALPQHISLQDAAGDSAIIEYTNGTLHIYHDRAHVVLTNEPSYADQLANLKQYKGFGGTKTLPGTLEPKDRFVRASYYLSRLPKPRSLQMEITQLFSVLDSASEHYEITDDLAPNPIPTIWRVIADLTHRTYYFDSSTRFNVIWIPLEHFNLKPGAPIMKLNVADENDLVGDVTEAFKPV